MTEGLLLKTPAEEIMDLIRAGSLKILAKQMCGSRLPVLLYDARGNQIDLYPGQLVGSTVKIRRAPAEATPETL